MLRKALIIAALLAAPGLGGCASLTRAILIPKFRIDVPAGQLQTQAPPAQASLQATTAPPGPADAAAIPAHEAREPAAMVAAGAPTERTDIRGAGDGSMKVDRVVISGAKPVPHRAPNFSAEQVAAMVCITGRIGFANQAARRAHQATLDARDARADLAAGKISQKQADAIELKRQDAVRAVMNPIPLLNMIGSTGDRKTEMPSPRYQSVVIENTDLFTFKENGKPVMAVSGVVRNTGKAAVELPPITLRALDDWDFALAGQSSLLPFETLAPGEAQRFELRFLNPPEYTGEVYVHFAPPFMYRGARDCDFFDPARFDPNQPVPPAGPEDDALKGPKLDIGSIRRFIADSGPHAGATTPDYTAAELNQLTRYYRRESERAWRCRAGGETDEQPGGEARCAGADQRLGWRDMFAMAETIDEAWSALRAAEEAKTALGAGVGSQASVDAAEAARAAAIARFRAMGEAALVRAGGSIAGVALDLTGSTLGYDGKMVYIDVAGRIRNTSAETRTINALMIAAVDRFGLPLSSTAAPFARTLVPDGSIEFHERVPVNRPPPRQFDWQVRVGAMGGAG